MRSVNSGMTVHALGTGGGPMVSSSRAGVGTMVVVDQSAYVVDCGMGSIRQYRDHATWGDLRAVFVTHMHSDHIYDLGAYLVTGWQVPGEAFSQPIEVYGPAAPVRLPHAPTAGNRGKQSARRMTGTREVVDALIDRVYASDVAIRMLDEGRDDPHSWVSGHDMPLPEGAIHENAQPFVVYADEKVEVLAILVDHGFCYPAYGFRINSSYGSVVISGDTAPCDALVRLAEGADLLLHEVIDLDAILTSLPDGPTRYGIAAHLRESHTAHDAVGAIAERAGVRQLVLHHIVPNKPNSTDPSRLVEAAERSFSGPVVVAEDGDIWQVRGAETEPATLLRGE